MNHFLHNKRGISLFAAALFLLLTACAARDAQMAEPGQPAVTEAAGEPVIYNKSLEISEVMLHNKATLMDGDGHFHPWIELHNMSDADAGLSGWSLSAGGDSNSAALQQENEDLRQQIAALESENAALTQENSDLKAENTALNDTAPESGDEESNPIDRFFDSVDSGSSTVEMDLVADSWAGAWEAECRNVAAWLKEQLPLQEDKDLVDAYIAAAEAQADRMNVMAIYPIADLTIPQT